MAWDHRSTALRVTFTPFLDGYAFIGVVCFLAYLSIYTLYFCIGWIMLFVLLRFIRMPIPMVLRRMRRLGVVNKPARQRI